MQITKIERTDQDVDNSCYEIKTPYIHTDDYGNTETFYKKEVRLCTEYDAQIRVDKEVKEVELQKIEEILAEILPTQ